MTHPMAEKREPCTHPLWQREGEVADGSCPICSAERIKELEVDLKRSEEWLALSRNSVKVLEGQAWTYLERIRALETAEKEMRERAAVLSETLSFQTGLEGIEVGATGSECAAAIRALPLRSETP